MTTMQLHAWLDQEDRDVAMHIRRHGCHITYVLGCGCSRPSCLRRAPFAYSTGFFGLGHPELFVLSVGPETAQGLINHLFDEVRRGRDLVPGELVTFLDWPHRVVPEVVPNPEEIALAAQRHYTKPPFDAVPLLQLTYDDLAGRFPWDEGYASEPWIQPRPGSFGASHRRSHGGRCAGTRSRRPRNLPRLSGFVTSTASRRSSARCRARTRSTTRSR